MLAIEFGWFLTEMGRQPWILRGYMRVSEAATHAGGLPGITIAFGVVYFIILFTATYVLIRMFKNNPPYKDVEKLEESRGEAS